MEPIANFFTFSDRSGGNFVFSLNSVETRSFSVSPGVSESFSLYLLGTTADTNLGYDATATSLTLTFNETGTSGFSASGTLSVPPSIGAVPEPASWAMFIGGFGLIGGAMRRRKMSLHFA